MPVLDVVNASAQKVDSVELDDKLFGEVGNTHVVWEVVHHHLASKRAGTHATKTRGEVAGPNRKMWKQKHTGRARMGSKKVVHWRGGGEPCVLILGHHDTVFPLGTRIASGGKGSAWSAVRRISSSSSSVVTRINRERSFALPRKPFVYQLL